MGSKIFKFRGFAIVYIHEATEVNYPRKFLLVPNKRMEKNSNDEITASELARYGAAVCTVGDQLYVWRGDTDVDDAVDLNVIYALDLNNCKRWRKIHTDWDSSSQVPLGKCSMAVCAIGDIIYTYGGWYGERFNYSRSNQLHGLYLQEMIWKEIVAVNPEDGPGKKDKCGMVEHAGKICIFGGYGYPTDHQRKNKLFSREPIGILGWTNELHLYDPVISESVIVVNMVDSSHNCHKACLMCPNHRIYCSVQEFIIKKGLYLF